MLRPGGARRAGVRGPLFSHGFLAGEVGVMAVPTLYLFDRRDERVGVLAILGSVTHAEELGGEDTLELACAKAPGKGDRSCGATPRPVPSASTRSRAPTRPRTACAACTRSRRSASSCATTWRRSSWRAGPPRRRWPRCSHTCAGRPARSAWATPGAGRSSTTRTRSRRSDASSRCGMENSSAPARSWAAGS